MRVGVVVSWVRHRVSVLFVAAAAAMPAAATAGAQETGGSAGRESMFPKGTWMLEFDAAYYHSIIDDEDIKAGIAGFGYYFDDKHAFRVELVGLHLHEEGPSPDADNATAAGGNLGLRYHYFERDRLSLFIDGSAGFFYGTRNWPEGGTHFNFNEQLGLGATFRIDERAHLIGGVRYIHVSNARIRGNDENPGFDGLGGFLGVLITF